MHWVAKVMLATTLALMASGCSGDSPKATPTPGATATSPTAEPTRVPPTVDRNSKSPTSQPPAVTYPPPRPKPSAADQATLATDPLVIYADEVGSTDFNGRSWPVVEVVSYNLRTGRIAGLFRVGEVGEFAYPAQVMLAGRKAVMNLEKRLVVANLDGSGQRTLFAAPAGGVLTSFAVSPDGTTVAVGAEAENFVDQSLAFLVFVDIRTGALIRRIEQSSFSDVGLPGTPGVTRWLGDGKTVRVVGIAHKGGGGVNRPTAIAGLDGSVRRSVLADEQVSAKEIFKVSFEDADVSYSCGMGAAPRRLTITQADSGQVVDSIAPEGYVVSTARWSQDGRTLLFSKSALVSKPDRPSPCYEGGGSATWQTWSVDGIRDVPDLRAQLKQWDGSGFVDLFCDGQPIAMQYPLNREYLTCDGSARTPPATLVIGGKPIDLVHQAAVVGFVE